MAKRYSPTVPIGLLTPEHPADHCRLPRHRAFRLRPVVVIAVPGLLTGLAAGLRGWALAGTAPLLSYAIGGLTGPWAAAAGWSFTPLTYAVSTVVFTAIAYGVRKPAVRRRPPEPEPGLWARRGHLAVVACLLFAAAAGCYATLRGLGRIGALPQGFDAVYHGNAVRYIADTGDRSLFGTGHVNWYGDARTPCCCRDCRRCPW
ncbi:DUF6541 family protein [Amycolatopsis australiensis]|uniref:Uncharacterized protein n=1 Tax=Amycolatopsis australiensis TaxID=546364 RepID=A0A1K1PTK1_9PSEU|nr:DUF6541 family protein [Amycolatopsis australiensis]SFW51050.1 hypothetical protein SAMN04489730_1020 [Amycolatopsis australiensis]